MRFTESALDKMACASGRKDRIVFDSVQRGLAVRIAASGSASYLCQFSINGIKRRVPLGNRKAISLKQAREAAQVMLGDKAKGLDPASARKQAIAASKIAAEANKLTLAVLIQAWQKHLLERKKARYAAEAPRAIEKAFASDLQKPANNLTAELVMERLNALRPVTATRTTSYARAMFYWAARPAQGYAAITSNPFKGLDLPKAKSRDRVLSDSELAAVWRASDQESWPFNTIVKLLILTGQRAREVSRMRWSELADDMATWTMPGGDRTKNGEWQILKLPGLAIELLKAAPRKGPMVFQVTSRKPAKASRVDGEFNSWSRTTKRLFQNAGGVKNATIHDFRRTLATGMQKLGVSEPTSDAILNHKDGKEPSTVGGVYRRYAYVEERGAALLLWADHIQQIIKAQSPPS